MSTMQLVGAMLVALGAALCGTADAGQIEIAAAGVSHIQSVGLTAPADAVNGVGLTGSDHIDDPNYEWLNGLVIDGSFFIIDLKKQHLLDATTSLKFWNSQRTWALRAVKFYLSDDFSTWVEKSATIKDSSGATVTVMPKGTATGFTGTVDFGPGVTARYIKIQADGGQNAGNYGYASRTGLAEIQAFGTPTGLDPVLSQKISVSTAAASSSHASAPVIHAVDGTGLTGTGDQHQGSTSTYYGWVAAATNPWMTIDLGEGVNQQIQGMKIWNASGSTALGSADSEQPSRGLRTVDIEVSNDNSTWTMAFDNLDITIGDDSTDTGSDFYDSPFVLDTRSAISGVWRYVRITMVQYWGGANNRLGLDEVQLFASYVPPTAAGPAGTIITIR